MSLEDRFAGGWLPRRHRRFHGSMIYPRLTQDGSTQPRASRGQHSLVMYSRLAALIDGKVKEDGHDFVHYVLGVPGAAL